MAGAQIEKPDGQAVTAAFRFPSIASEFAQSVSFGPISRLFAKKAVPLPPDHPESAVGWVAGAAAMARFDVLQQVGFFDPTFFLYYEEVDLMRQVANQGWEIWYVPSAEVIHIEGAATQVKSGQPERRRKPAYWYESWQYYFRKNHGRAGAIIAAVGCLLGAACNHIIAFVLRRQPASALHFFPDFWGTALRPIAGFERAPL